MKRTTAERIANLLFGLSFFGWAIAGCFAEGELTVVRICIAVLHVTAGSLIIFRSPTERNADWKALAGCLPSIIAAGVVFRLADSTTTWTWGWSALFSAATIWSAISLCFLGNSFAVFPSVRQIRTHGPYQWIRHPAYLGELVMMACCVGIVGTPLAWICMALALSTIVVRILIEEKMLMRTDAYQQYAQQVRSRLIPFVW